MFSITMASLAVVEAGRLLATGAAERVVVLVVDEMTPLLHAVRFSPWKRPIVRAFFQGSRVTFVRNPAHLPAGAL